MKMTICGSMAFYNKMVELQAELKAGGHSVALPDPKGMSLDFSTMTESEQVETKRDFMNEHVDKIRDSEAILVANYDKDGQENYIGTSAFMEITTAYALKKKIYILNKIPNQSNKLEIAAIGPVALNSDISLL